MTIDGLYGLKCPTTVDKTNWADENDFLNFDRRNLFQYKFSVVQNGSQITVKSLDKTYHIFGWGIDLKFRCCPADSNKGI